MVKYILSWVVYVQTNINCNDKVLCYCYKWEKSRTDRLEFYNRDSALQMMQSIRFNTHKFGVPDINLKLDSIIICK